jgi:hypothetical protein
VTGPVDDGRTDLLLLPTEGVEDVGFVLAVEDTLTKLLVFLVGLVEDNVLITDEEELAPG